MHQSYLQSKQSFARQMQESYLRENPPVLGHDDSKVSIASTISYAGEEQPTPAPEKPVPGIESGNYGNRTLATHHEHLANAFNSKIDKLHGAVQLNHLPLEQALPLAQEHHARMQQALEAYLHRDWNRAREEILAKHGDSPAVRQLLAAAKQRFLEAHQNTLSTLQNRVNLLRSNATPQERRDARSDVQGALQALSREPDSARSYVAQWAEPQRRAMQLREALRAAEGFNGLSQPLPESEKARLQEFQGPERFWQIHPTSQGVFGVSSPEMQAKKEAHLPTSEGWAVHHQHGDEWRRGWRPVE